MKYGFIPDQIKDTDYILGGSPVEGVILCPSGQWLNRISGGEAQRRFGVETMSCVSFGTLNIVEILIKELFSVSADYSDRYLSSMAQTTPSGNSPQKVFDVLRKEAGCIDEQDLPFDESVKSFNDYIIKEIPKTLIRKGEEWRSKYDLKYERAFNGGTIEEKRKQLMEGLKRSPLRVSVAAWHQNEKGLYYKPSNVSDNHFTLLCGYEEGKKFFVYDSYPESEGDFIKELDWNYDFGVAYVFYLRNIEKELKWYEQIINLLAQIIGLQAIYVAEVIKKIVEPEEPIIEKYLWDNPQNVRHSVRVICDEMGLSVDMKNKLCETIKCESEFNPKAKHINTNGTKDCGIAQFSENYYLKYNNMTCQQAIDEPERCIRIMVRAFKNGRAKDWICYRRLYG